MSNFVYVVEVKTQPIFQLVVTRPRIADKVSQSPDQTEIQSFHITLARLDDYGQEMPDAHLLPTPPATIELDDQLWLVDSGEKKSIYVRVTEHEQRRLQRYVEACSLGAESLLDPNREFHITVSNAGDGGLRSSVGSVWDYESVPV